MDAVLADNKLLHSRHDLDANSLISCPCPWILICDERKNERFLFFNFVERRFYFVSMPSFCNKCIWSCWDNGWLLLENNGESGDSFIFNLISMETVQLPPLPEAFNGFRRSCIVTTPPTDPNCRVILVESLFEHLYVWQSGEDKFVEETIMFDDPDFMVLTVTTFKGMIYALVFPNIGLAEADFTDPGNFEILWTESPEKSVAHDVLYYLVEVDDELLLIRQPIMVVGLGGFDEVLDFIIFRADFEDMKWVKVENIGDNAIFLNLNQGFACSVRGLGIRGNSIYYSLNTGREYYVYNLEDKSVTIFPTCTEISMRHSELFFIRL